MRRPRSAGVYAALQVVTPYGMSRLLELRHAFPLDQLKGDQLVDGGAVAGNPPEKGVHPALGQLLGVLADGGQVTPSASQSSLE